MNKVLLMGRLVKNPELSTTQSGNTIARMTLAVDRVSKDNGTDFIALIAWNKTAEFAGRYLTKGRQIIAEGRIQTGSYEKDGKRVYTTDIIADRLEFCGSKNDGQNAESVPF